MLLAMSALEAFDWNCLAFAANCDARTVDPQSGSLRQALPTYRSFSVIRSGSGLGCRGSLYTAHLTSTPESDDLASTARMISDTPQVQPDRLRSNYPAVSPDPAVWVILVLAPSARGTGSTSDAVSLLLQS
jgi:hypothetical protein